MRAMDRNKLQGHYDSVGFAFQFSLRFLFIIYLLENILHIFFPNWTK